MDSPWNTQSVFTAYGNWKSTKRWRVRRPGAAVFAAFAKIYPFYGEAAENGKMMALIVLLSR